LIVQAVDKVRDSIPNIHASLLGSGEYRENLIQLTRELDLGDHITISKETLPVSELPPLICSADVGIVPNRSNIFTDGLLPTKLMEYVAVGTPVIAARTPTIATYFDETMVQFFEPGNVEDLAGSIMALYNDRQRLSQFARNSDRFNQQYNWDKVAEVYATLVDQLNNV